MPPPMALHEISLKDSIVDVSIMVDHLDLRCIRIIVLHHGGCSLFEWPVASMIHMQPSLKWSSNPCENRHPGLMYIQVAFNAKNGSVLLLSNDTEASMIQVLDRHGQSLGKLSSHIIAIESFINIGPCSDHLVFVRVDENSNQGVNDLEKKIVDLNRQTGIRLTIPPFHIARSDAISCGRTAHGSPSTENVSEDMIFSLSENGSLFANQRRLAKNCISFLVTPAHLIYTTSQHILKFLHMAEKPEGMIPTSSLFQIIPLF